MRHFIAHNRGYAGAIALLLMVSCGGNGSADSTPPSALAAGGNGKGKGKPGTGGGGAGPHDPYDAAIASRSTLSQFGITWKLDRRYTTGKFANGDWWVVGPVKIVKIEPGSVTGTRIMNGSMVNPSPTLSVRQGYDNTMSNAPYDSSLNVGLDVARSRALTLEPHSSLVTTISVTEEYNRPQIEDSAILTVLDKEAGPGDFRPPYSGADKTVRFNISQLQSSLLKRLAPTSSAPALADVERKFERPWLDHMPGWIGTECHPRNAMPHYGRDIAIDVSIGALTLQLDHTIEEKLVLLVRYVQLGIDLTGVALDGGDNNWINAGGHASGRKWPILFAGIMLDDAQMMAIDSANISFGEDQQTWIVTEADVGRPLTPNPSAATELYEQSDVGMPEWGIEHATRPERDNANWYATYRLCCTANSWHGFTLAAMIMGARPLWDHEPLFLYMDRYVSETRLQNNPPYQVSFHAWTIEMWDAYRSNY